MNWFGRKAAQGCARPALSRVYGTWSAPAPLSYEAQLREGYLGNAIVQRAVRLVAEAAGSAEAGGATLQWISRGGTALTEIDVPMAARALRPLMPVHGLIQPDGAGGVTIDWVRRSRVDTGWRDHVDQAAGESREAWHMVLSPSVPGVGPWESLSPRLNIGAGAMAGLPPGCTIMIRQAGDFALSAPLSLPLT